jgi:hypothetical protein
VMNNVAFSLAGISEKANGWTTAVRETKSGVTRDVAPNGLWLGGIGYGLYSGSVPSPAVTPVVLSIKGASVVGGTVIPQ